MLVPLRNAHIRTVASSRREILALAGFTPRHLSKAISVLRKALDANKVRFAVSNGKVIGRVEVPDWDNRLKACHQIFALAGLYREESKASVGTLNVQVINYGTPLPKKLNITG
jgi:hypothetical protein